MSQRSLLVSTYNAMSRRLKRNCLSLKFYWPVYQPKVNRFNGIGVKCWSRQQRGDGRAGDVDGRLERKERTDRKRPLYYRDQLPATVSYGICCTECHVALLHWDSVSGKEGNY